MMEFRESQVTEVKDRRVDAEIDHPKAETHLLVRPVVIEVPGIECDECGASWYPLDGEDEEDVKRHYRKHKEDYCP